MIIYIFLEFNNLKGKGIVTFCTSGGREISRSIKGIKAAAKGAKVVKEKDLTDMSNKSIGKIEKGESEVGVAQSKYFMVRGLV